ncbi:hypothetical protein PHYPSEUDO_004830 [Phytophthora pseudosyringae]|uniref:Uncharacterized protein n=1 Tax=Phytophthora pseudosyringae TaxID=221518 RepID=A0A8T1VME1_9STRA|nr:hypothetical protein PHYPSEUDO_004830 [Phytophthora pseudosyringae]
MNRLLQHFVDSGGAPAARPPIAAPPQSSGGSHHAGNRGSYQRAAPGGPFYYQPPPHAQSGGLEEIPLTSQSTGAIYETVDLNADSGQQQQQLFTSTSQDRSFGYKVPTPPSSRESNRQHMYPQQKPPGSTGSISELFASGPPPARAGGSSGNPYRRQSKPMNDPFAASPAASNGGGGLGNATTPPKELFAASAANGAAMFGHSAPRNGGGVFEQAPQNDPFAKAPRSDENTNVFGNGASAHDPCAVRPPKAAGFEQGMQQQQQHQQPANPAADPFASSGSSPFDSLALSNSGHQRMASADSLFATPAPTINGEWAQPAPSALPRPPPARQAQAKELFASDAPSASSLFGGDAPSPFQMGYPTPPKPQTNAPALPPEPHVRAPPPPGKPQFNVPPSPEKPRPSVPPSPMKPPVAAPPSPMINASSPPMRPQVLVPASPVMRPEDHLTPAVGSMRLSTPTKSPLKSGLDARHMKFPTGKRDDDTMSNAPSVAPSRMSMLSTLDDSLKLSDMYKHMTSRLEGEKHDLLKVVASQAQEIAQMKTHIKSLELQLKKYRPQDA